MMDNTHYLTVTDLKQYIHCQRVVFYERCLPHIRPRTYKMDAGRDAHQREQKRASRRTLKQYGEGDGRREFDLPLESAALALRGAVDEVVFTADGQIIPIDYKLAKKVGQHHRLQLAAYAALLEEQYQQVISHGFIYLIPVRQTHQIEITSRLRDQLRSQLRAMLLMIQMERMPPPAPHFNYCVACEFRRFCNDVGG